MAVSNFAQIAPSVQLVVVLEPALADVVAIVHVGNHDIADSRIRLGLGLTHRLTHSAHDEHDTGGARHVPLAVHLLHILDVNLFRDTLLEQDRRVLGNRQERRVVIEGKGRYDDAYADLKAALDLELRIRAGGQITQELPDRGRHAFLLDADGRIAEACRELERIDAVPVHDAVEVDVTDVALLGESRLHLLERRVEKSIRTAPEHGGAHLAGGGTDVAGEELLVLEVHIQRIDELLAVEESADRDLHTRDAPLQLEDPDLVGK